MSEGTVIKEVERGEVVEGMRWQIIENYSDCDYNEACKHMIKPKDERFIRSHSILPRGVRAYNEAGYNCTIVCLDCILENAS